MGLVALTATVILTFPAGAAAAQRLTADIWPNSVQPDTNVITDIGAANTVTADIWPNGSAIAVGLVDGSTQSD